MNIASRFVGILGVVTLLAACASNDTADEYVERPVDELYNTAQNLLEQGEYENAGTAFEEVERQHPYSQWATKAQVMAAFSFYEGQRYDQAIASAERFIDLHPGSSDVAYAHYLIAISYYDQISDVKRDQDMTRQALRSFDELIRRFPDSDYAKDARLKRDLTTDHLAGKEMSIGRYYQDRGQFVAAINRFQNVVEDYETTTHAPEALHRLVESYLALGITAEAQKTAAVLGHNYPDNEWYARSYALMTGSSGNLGTDQSWLDRIF